ncbi:hypothetical protein [Oceanospirillum maris]|uniref:hypothetical protein n=1 Tax=Oceanospirillum maris TaxID=64977 RepID=UPI000421123D|nr:hypothetical protein [Oceanospirillum maris]
MFNTTHYFNRFINTSTSATPVSPQSTDHNNVQSKIQQAAQQASEGKIAQPQQPGIEDGAKLEAIDWTTYKPGYNDLFRGEQKVKADALLERMSPEQQDFIISNIGDYVSLLKDDDIFQLAENLSDEEVSQFTDIMIAMQSEGHYGYIYPKSSDFQGPIHIRDVMQTLADSKPSLRQQILDQAHIYAEQVQLTEKPDTYSRKELLNPPKNSSMDNLKTFLNTLHNVKDHQSLMNNLDSVDETQKIPLMQVYILDEELAVRSHQMLKNKAFSPEAKEGLLQFIAETAEKTLLYTKGWQLVNSSKDLENTSLKLDQDDHYYGVGTGMIEDTLDLLDNYRFTDDQLLNMTGELNRLDRSNQRAYIEITVQGMGHLFGKDHNEEPVDMADHKAALSAIASVRGNSDARNLVMLSRLGEYKEYDEYLKAGQYFAKQNEDSAKDMSQTAEALVSHAWLSQHRYGVEPPIETADDSYQAPMMNFDTIKILRQLHELSAKERDLSIDRLHTFSALSQEMLDPRLTESAENQR